MVPALAHHPNYAAVDDKHGAGSAGCHAAIKGRALYGNSAFCRLADGVLLGVYGSDTVGGNGTILVEHLFELMADIVTVGKAGGSPDVACYQKLVVLGDDAAGTAPVTGSPFGNGIADLHKVLVPGGPFVYSFPHTIPAFVSAEII